MQCREARAATADQEVATRCRKEDPAARLCKVTVDKVSVWEASKVDGAMAAVAVVSITVAEIVHLVAAGRPVASAVAAPVRLAVAAPVRLVAVVLRGRLAVVVAVVPVPAAVAAAVVAAVIQAAAVDADKS